MKKWILVLMLYGLGTLLLYDVSHGSEWLEYVVDSLIQVDHSAMYLVYTLIFMIPVGLILINYFVLRIRANNPAFTFINAIFVSLLFILLASRNAAGIAANGILPIFERLANGETWEFLWRVYKVAFVAMGINIVSGIVISEAKTKGAYLTAEFIYLVTGLSLAITLAFVII